MIDWVPRLGWGPTVTLALFVCGYFIRWGLDAWEKRGQRRKYFISIFTEIKLNVIALDEAIKVLPPQAAIAAFLAKNNTNRPHMISNYISKIYESHSSQLTELPDTITRNIIEFYGMLDFIDEFVKSFERKSFETISADGREKSVEALRAQFKATLAKGQALADLLKRELKVPDLA